MFFPLLVDVLASLHLDACPSPPAPEGWDKDIDVNLNAAQLSRCYHHYLRYLNHLPLLLLISTPVPASPFLVPFRVGVMSLVSAS